MSEESQVSQKSWTKSDVFLLISQWELYPELWNVKNKLYRNRIKKQNALKEIASNFNTTTNEVSRKLHNLRTQYHSEVRRIKCKKSGNGAEENNTSSWEFFSAMNFINTNHSSPVTTDNMVSISI